MKLLKHKINRYITNNSSAIVWKWENNNAYGLNPAEENISGAPFEYNIRFAGQYFDKESGLHYNYHRMYNPMTGRYMQPDPLGVDGGMNVYSYVENNPLNAVDPYGLKKLFAGDVLKDNLMLTSWSNDKDDPTRLIIYGHGNSNGIFVSFNSGLNINRNNLSILEISNSGRLIDSPIEFIEFLRMNKININDYNSIEIRSCDVGRGSFAQNLSNYIGKNVYAADDYYYFSNYSVGVKSTYFNSRKPNNTYLTSPFNRGLTKFLPRKEIK